jgi:hypothetical protein
MFCAVSWRENSEKNGHPFRGDRYQKTNAYEKTYLITVMRLVSVPFSVAMRTM